jgi:hypothetical protein
MMGLWKAYYPDEGETADDAIAIEPRKYGPRIFDAEGAAERACEIDYDERDGWERTHGTAFPIVIVAPDGTETRWSGRHEPSVDHVVSEWVDEE